MSFMDAHQSRFGFPQSHASGGGGTIEATGWSYQAIRSVANPQRGIPGTGRSWFDPWLGQTKPNRLYVWHIGWRLDSCSPRKHKKKKK